MKVKVQNNYALKVEHIFKTFGENLVLNDVSLEVEKGEIYGFVGSNGAGKTTLIRVVSGLVIPDSGSYSILGIDSNSQDIYKARKNVGAIVETPSIVPNYNAYKSLKYQASLIGRTITDEEIKQILEFVGLADVEGNKKSGNYSLGMKQRLGIANALVGEPQLLILDEPINGLDPTGIVELRNLILKLKNEKNIAFLISSHILSELSLIADKFGFISHGKMIKEITKEELESSCKKVTIIKTTDDSKAFGLINDILLNEYASLDEHGINIEADNLNISDIITKLSAEGINILNVTTKEASLESYYLEIMGGNN